MASFLFCFLASSGAPPTIAAPATAPAAAPAARPPAAFDHAHQGLARVLKGAVIGDRVDYVQVKARLPELNHYLEQLAATPPGQLEAFSREQRLAFWINAYNAHVLQTVATAFPVASIRDIPGVFNQRTFQVAGQTLTLDRLENEIIRPRFQEPRIHLALNCAARSCPPLQAEPFRADRLEAQLEAAASHFLRNPDHVRIDVVKKVVSVPKIFEWFADDFMARFADAPARPGRDRRTSAVLNFLSRYVEDDAHRTFLSSGSPDLRFLEYDWSLNARR